MADLRLIAVVPMRVAVDQVLGMIPLHKAQEALESAMGRIGSIVDSPRRRVGNQDVNGTPPTQAVVKKLGPHPDDLEAQVKLGILRDRDPDCSGDTLQTRR